MIKMETIAVIKYPLSTEKSIKLVDSENTVVFVVDNRSKKEDIRKAISEIYKLDALSIRTMVDFKGRKKAYVRFKQDSAALDLATELGLL